jgi:hypothetical protein
MGRLLDLPESLKYIARDKHSSLFCASVYDKEKRFKIQQVKVEEDNPITVEEEVRKPI